jgi:Transposase IS66 family
MRYALGRWGQLRRFLDYGQLELSNNLAENAIRPVAIGRNYEQLGIRQSYNGRIARRRLRNSSSAAATTNIGTNRCMEKLLAKSRWRISPHSTKQA